VAGLHQYPQVLRGGVGGDRPGAGAAAAVTGSVVVQCVAQCVQAEENIGKIRQPVGGAANMTGFWAYQWDSRCGRRREEH
jgi:hypothetical protein